MSEDGSNVLSDREMEILRLVAQGLSNREVARELFISHNTVKVHLRNIYSKLEVSSRTEATMVAVRQGWVAVGTEASEEAAEGAASEGLAGDRATILEPVAAWQKGFLLAALTVVLVALVWTWPRPAPAAGPTENPLADNPGPVALRDLPNLPSRWQEEVPLSIARGRLAVAAVNGRVYAIGGETPGGDVTGAVEAYDPAHGVWSLKASKPVPVANVSGATLAGKIYVPGGLAFNDGITDRVEAYDPAADRWHEVAPLPAPRAAYALAVHDGRLYLFGGTDGQQDVATVYVYDPQRDEWQIGPAMPSARAFAGAAALEEAIYVVGGYTGGRELDTCQLFRPAEGTWEACAPMLDGRGGLSLVAAGRKLYAVGGGWENYLVYNQWYDPGRDVWLRFETPITGQWRSTAAAELNGKLYVVGGWSDEFLNANLAYQATYNVFLPFSTSDSDGN
jgi:DNA-binding CsgD family transcriptional regulator